MFIGNDLEMMSGDNSNIKIIGQSNSNLQEVEMDIGYPSSQPEKHEALMPENSPHLKVNNQKLEGKEQSTQGPWEKTIMKMTPKWQDRLLPVMIGLLFGLTLFFFISTFIQMSYLHQRILDMPEFNLKPPDTIPKNTNLANFEDWLEARHLEVRSNMEAFIILQRYRQANVVLMANLWIRYLGFITGMILAIVGASFVLGKLREPEQHFEGKFSGIGLALRTTSPGIILVVLGVVLMFTTLVDEDFYKVTDGNIYMSPNFQESAPEGSLFDTTLRPPPIIDTLISDPSDQSTVEPP